MRKAWRVGESISRLHFGLAMFIRDGGPQKWVCAMRDVCIPISVLILTKNEELGIASCLGALTDFDEVFVVDSNSDDATQNIAKSMGVNVVPFTWNGQYPKKKQWILENVLTKNDWVLLLDADERPTPELLDELSILAPKLNSDIFAGYDIPLDYVFDGRVLRYGHTVVKRSLLRREKQRFIAVEDIGAPGIGEVEGHYQPPVEGAIGRLTGSIIHEDKDPIRTWFNRHNNYSDWEAWLVMHPSAARQVNALRSGQGQKFAKVPFKPIVFFVYDYILKRGFLDGRAGFNYAVALSWYYWLTGLKIREAKRSTR